MTALSTRIVDAVASETGVDAASLDPLYDVIDPDALDAVFSRTETGVLSLSYAGFAVSVFASGEVEIDALEESGEGERASV